MLSNFCVVLAITRNISVGLAAAGPGAAVDEPQDDSAPASRDATAAATTHVPPTRLMRSSPRTLCSDRDGDLGATAGCPALPAARIGGPAWSRRSQPGRPRRRPDRRSRESLGLAGV